jgi:beta-fructofuranosidase
MRRGYGLRHMNDDDPQRPIYHFLPPANWMNDPNGFIQWQSTYHLFYQYNPSAAVHDNMHWGHAASEDLVRWRHLPIALAPTPGGPDARGCWSGVTVNDAGTPTIVYSGAVGKRQRACLATSDDGLLTWRKDPGNPIIPEPPAELDVVEYRDHSVWREADGWYQLMGAGLRHTGGAALLYRSGDLRHWEYLHPLCANDPRGADAVWNASMWECPDFFALGDRHVLIVSVWDNGQLHYAAAATGTYQDHRFTPHRTFKLDYGQGHFYAPQSARADDGRRVLIGWLQEGRGVPAQVAAGWSGAMSLPRELTLGSDGSLCSRPVAEVQRLRGGCIRLDGVDVPAGDLVLEEIDGDALELQVVLQPPADGRCGVAVRRAVDGLEQTRIVYDARTRGLSVDRASSSLDPNVRSTPHTAALDLTPGEPLRLHIFVDRSVLEVFANDRLSIATRIYPTRRDSLGVALLADTPGGRVVQLEAWQMLSIWGTA